MLLATFLACRSQSEEYSMGPATRMILHSWVCWGWSLSTGLEHSGLCVTVGGIDSQFFDGSLAKSC